MITIQPELRSLLERIANTPDAVLGNATLSGEDFRTAVTELRAMLGLPAKAATPNTAKGDAQADINRLICFEFLPNELQTVNAHDLLRIYKAGQDSVAAKPLEPEALAKEGALG